MSYQLGFPLAHQFERPEAVFRKQHKDFIVEEELGFELTGSGEHQWLFIEKIGINTMDVARLLSEITGSRIQEIGYSGLKDKHAVSRQWFSVKGKVGLTKQCSLPEGIRVLDQQRNSKKLRKGSHKSNSFKITLREVAIDDLQARSVTEVLKLKGVPNYFGPQRFGVSGNNMLKAEALLTGKLVKIPRFQRGIYLSAARSYLFNSLLANRVKGNQWDQFMPGDVMALTGSSSVFKAEQDDEEIPARLFSLDIHPTGPMWGAGELSTSQDVKSLEINIATQFRVLAEGLAVAGLNHERRALRVVPVDLKISQTGDSERLIEFSLPKGAYATSVLREIVKAPGL